MTFLTLALGRFERLHKLRLQGSVDDDLWDSWLLWVRETWFGNPLAKKIWSEEGRYFSAGFQRLIEKDVLGTA